MFSLSRYLEGNSIKYIAVGAFENLTSLTVLWVHAHIIIIISIIIINNGNRTEWSPIRSVIIRVITQSDDREAGVWFVNHEYDYRPTSDETKSHYQLIISITILKDPCQECA